MTPTQVEEVISAQNRDSEDELRLFGEIAIAMGFIDESALRRYIDRE